MNVQVVRSGETSPSDAASPRARAGGADFPAMMDSALSGTTPERPAQRPGARDPGREPVRDPSNVRARDARPERAEERRAEEADDARDPSAGREAERPVEASAPPARRSGSRRSQEEEQGAAAERPVELTEPVLVEAAAIVLPEALALGQAAPTEGTLEEAEPAERPASSRPNGAAIPGLPSLGVAPAGGVDADEVGVAPGTVPERAANDSASALPLQAAPEAEEGGAERSDAAPQVAAVVAEERLGRDRAAGEEAVGSEPSREARATARVDARGDAAMAAEGAVAGRATRAVPDARPLDARTSTRAAEGTPGSEAGGSEVPVARASEGRAPIAAPADAAPVDPTAARGGEGAATLRSDGFAYSAPAPVQEAAQPGGEPGRPLPAAAPDAIRIQTDWLATRGGGTARLLLHPPELGEIAIRVTVRHQAVDVVMVAHTALAQQAAEDQSERLSQAFANRDLRLEQFEVRRGDPSDASSTGQFGSSDAGARERERAEERAFAGTGGGGRHGAGRGGAAGEPGATPPPRIVSSGRAAGIDLRI